MAFRFYFVLVACLLGTGCASSVRFQEDLADYREAEARLQGRLVERPDDAEALRDLGVIYLRTNHFDQAGTYLERALAQDPADPKTIFHLGLSHESAGRREAALRLYERYPEVPRLSPYRRLLAGRYELLVRRLAEEELGRVLAEEASLAGTEASPEIVAVFPLSYGGGDERYAPLGRGLAEMITVDLTHVGQLRLVERTRLQALLNELALGQSEYVDPATAPRVGRLLGAGRLVGGVYNVLGEDNLRLDASLWEAQQATPPALETQAGLLDNFFRLEKQLVFSLIEGMGIELTPEEREQIEFIPTQNLQAFLAYSRGLEREDAGAFGEAGALYRQAAGLDASFEAAADRAEVMEGMTLVPGTPAEAIAAVQGLDPAPEATRAVGADPLALQLRLLNQNLGQNFIPGLDAREPAADLGGAAPFGGLPDPPPPPGTR